MAIKTTDKFLRPRITHRGQKLCKRLDRWTKGATPSLLISYSTAHFCFAKACKEDLLYTRLKKPSILRLPKGTQTVLTCWFSGFLSLAGNLEVYKRSREVGLNHFYTKKMVNLKGSCALPGCLPVSHSKNWLPMNLCNYYGTWQIPKHAFHIFQSCWIPLVKNVKH